MTDLATDSEMLIEVTIKSDENYSLPVSGRTVSDFQYHEPLQAAYTLLKTFVVRAKLKLLHNLKKLRNFASKNLTSTRLSTKKRAPRSRRSRSKSSSSSGSSKSSDSDSAPSDAWCLIGIVFYFSLINLLHILSFLSILAITTIRGVAK